MVVQHNISGMNANRQLNITTGIQAKSSEKLSSGYKINRAADDAAGLSISEKMRRQVRGLTQASRNSQDGISFVQIADGALTEVHDMLQRCNELAVKAANETLTNDDREYINAEVTKIKEEIDSIGGKTTFNEIPVFPKDGASVSEATPAQKELAKKIADEMVPTAMKQIVNALSGSLGWSLGQLAAVDPEAYAADLSITYIDGPSNILATMGARFYPGNPGMDAFSPGSLIMKVDSSDFSSSTIGDGLRQELESTIAHELMHGVMDVLLPEGMYSKDTGVSGGRGDGDYNFPLWFKEGTAQLVGGGYTTGWNVGLINIANSSDSEADKLAKTSSYLDQYSVEDRVYGHGYLECAYLCQLASGQGLSAGAITSDSLRAGANNIFNALALNEANYAGGGTGVKSFEAVINSAIGASGKTLADTINEMNSGGVDASAFALYLTMASQPGDESGMYGAGSIVASSLKSSFVLGAVDTTPQAIYIKNANASATEDPTAAVLYLQVGSEKADSDELPLKRFALSCDAIGIGDTDTLTADSSLEAITWFKSALVNVSTMRSYYGAMQNRLEHTVRNLDNVTENTQGAESRIRDTDMAEEMVRYSNINILAQAGQSMLAQANQTNQGVMSLLQ